MWKSVVYCRDRESNQSFGATPAVGCVSCRKQRRRDEIPDCSKDLGTNERDGHLLIGDHFE